MNSQSRFKQVQNLRKQIINDAYIFSKELQKSFNKIEKKVGTSALIEIKDKEFEDIKQIDLSNPLDISDNTDYECSKYINDIGNGWVGIGTDEWGTVSEEKINLLNTEVLAQLVDEMKFLVPKFRAIAKTSTEKIIKKYNIQDTYDCDSK